MAHLHGSRNYPPLPPHSGVVPRLRPAKPPAQPPTDTTADDPGGSLTHPTKIAPAPRPADGNSHGSRSSVNLHIVNSLIQGAVAKLGRAPLQSRYSASIRG